MLECHFVGKIKIAAEFILQTLRQDNINKIPLPVISKSKLAAQLEIFEYVYAGLNS